MTSSNDRPNYHDYELVFENVQIDAHHEMASLNCAGRLRRFLDREID